MPRIISRDDIAWSSTKMLFVSALRHPILPGRRHLRLVLIAQAANRHELELWDVICDTE